MSADPWRGWNPVDPALREDPYPAMARLRAEAPVHQTPIGSWRLMRYEDVVRLLRATPTGIRKPDGTLFGAPEGYRELRADGFLLRQDPPHHTRLRRLLGKAFTRGSIERMRERVQAVADELVDRALEAREFDAIEDLALPLPATVFCELLGVPIADRERCARWTADATHSFAYRLAAEADERAQAAMQCLEQYITELIGERREHLGEDLLSTLIRAEADGDRLSFDELVSQAMGLLIAGFETTIGAVGNGLLALTRHPGELRKLARQPDLLSSAVEECLRYDGPLLFTSRFLREDTRFGDEVIPRDSSVWAVIASANRDPAFFSDPERFDIARSPNPHITFGVGAHFCPGNHLGRMECEIAIGSLVRRAPVLEPTGPHEWGPSLFRVLGKLPLRVVESAARSAPQRPVRSSRPRTQHSDESALELDPE